MSRQFVSGLIGASIAIAPLSSAFGADDVSVSAGVRVWSNQWQGNSIFSANGTTPLTRSDSGTTSVPSAIVSVRYKNFGMTASSTFGANYTLSDGTGSAVQRRTESDINFLMRN